MGIVNIGKLIDHSSFCDSKHVKNGIFFPIKTINDKKINEKI